MFHNKDLEEEGRMPAKLHKQMRMIKLVDEKRCYVHSTWWLFGARDFMRWMYP